VQASFPSLVTARSTGVFAAVLGLMAALACLEAAAAGAADGETATLPAAATRPVDFVREIQPILTESCHSCHGPKKQESGLRLDRRSDALRGGET
jgi:hypothetical protein